MAKTVIDLEDSTFDGFVSGSTPALVDFWASWCGPCKMMAPVVDEIAEAFKTNLRVAKMNVDANSSIPGRMGVSTVPTLVLFQNGAEKMRLVGYHSVRDLTETLNENLN